MEARQFGSGILSSLGQLQREKYFCDVTIACEGRQIEAHKVVLARGSRIFNNILKLNSQPHPLIFLSNVKFSYLLNILDFMYQGEFSIVKRELDAFLRVARDLEVNNITEEAIKDLKQCDIDNSKTQLHRLEPDVNADYKVKTDNIPDDSHSIVNDLKVENFEDIETFKNEDFEDGAKDINIKTHPMDSSPEHDLNVDYIIKIEIENKNSEINGKTILIQDNVNSQSNTNEQNYSHEKKLRIRNIANLSANEKQDQFTSFENDICRGSFECEQCNKTYSYRKGLTQHVLAVHQGKRYPCSHCDYKATTNKTLERHVLSIHEGMRVSCSHCDHKATTKDNLKLHMLNIHEGKRYPCSHCDYKATSKKNLNTHVFAIHEGLRFSCSHCDYKATTKGSLKLHILNIHEGKRYPCSDCDYKATVKSNLKTHIKRRHL